MTNSVSESPSRSPLTIALTALTRLPENASFKNIAEELRIAEAFEEAYEDVMEGSFLRSRYKQG